MKEEIADGSIVIEIDYTVYTVYPEGLVPEECADDMQPDAVNLVYVSETSFGPVAIWHHK